MNPNGGSRLSIHDAAAGRAAGMAPPREPSRLSMAPTVSRQGTSWHPNRKLDHAPEKRAATRQALRQTA